MNLKDIPPRIFVQGMNSTPIHTFTAFSDAKKTETEKEALAPHPDEISTNSWAVSTNANTFKMMRAQKSNDLLKFPRPAKVGGLTKRYQFHAWVLPHLF